MHIVLYHVTWSGLPGLIPQSWDNLIEYHDTFPEFRNFVHVTLYMTRLLLFTFSILHKATFKVVDTGFKIDPFTILKVLYPMTQPTRSEKSCHIHSNVYIKTIKYFEPVKQTKPHWEIISRPDPLSGFIFHLIYPNPLRNAPDPPLNISTGSAFDQI